MTLEADMGREVTCYLFDAPHPVQFKADWNDVPGGGGGGDGRGEHGGNDSRGVIAADRGDGEEDEATGELEATGGDRVTDEVEEDEEEESTGLAYMEGP